MSSTLNTLGRVDNTEKEIRSVKRKMAHILAVHQVLVTLCHLR